MPTIIGNTELVGTRLRAERDRLRLSQSELARIAGVSRNSQTAYETGKTPFTSEYLALVTEAGMDPLFIITGTRSTRVLTDEQASMLSAFDAANPTARSALLYLACSMVGRTAPVAPFNLPSTAALTDAFGGLLEASPGLVGDELARELAKRLPIILRSAEDEIVIPQSGSHGDPVGHQGDHDDDRRAAQPRRRT